MSKQTRKDKIKKSDTSKPRKRSKYARKVINRRKLAIKLGLPPNTPMPVICQIMEMEQVSE